MARPELFQMLLEHVQRTWEPDMMPCGMSRDASGQLSVYAIAGGGDLIREVMLQAIAAGAVEVAVAFETWWVQAGDPEEHARRIRRYGPSFANWPDELRGEVVSLSYDSAELGHYGGRLRIEGATLGELEEYGPSAKSFGRLVQFFPRGPRD